MEKINHYFNKTKEIKKIGKLEQVTDSSVMTKKTEEEKCSWELEPKHQGIHPR